MKWERNVANWIEQAFLNNNKNNKWKYSAQSLPVIRIILALFTCQYAIRQSKYLIWLLLSHIARQRKNNQMPLELKKNWEKNKKMERNHLAESSLNVLIITIRKGNSMLSWQSVDNTIIIMMLLMHWNVIFNEHKYKYNQQWLTCHTTLTHWS